MPIALVLVVECIIDFLGDTLTFGITLGSAGTRRLISIDALILQGEVGTLTVSQFIIVLQTDIIRHAIVVGAVVGDVQLTIAVDECQVTVAIDTTHMLGTNRDEVAVEDVDHIGRHIAVHGLLVGIDAGIAYRHVTTGKDGIMDDDTGEIQFVPVCAVG